MYLRKFQKRKDGKLHTYWGLVESIRIGGKPRQRLVAHLGPLTGDQTRPYELLARTFNRPADSGYEQPDFLPEDDDQALQPVEILPGRIQCERVLDFGDAWMGTRLWNLLGFDEFFERRLPKGREDVPWHQMIAWSAIARFCMASSELALAERFKSASALSDLLAINPDKINDDRLYRTLDQLLEHRGELMKHLKERYTDLFASDHELLLYDLTSTYFEGEAEANPRARRGYSRDGRPDAKQVVIALVVTREGLPLCCEVFPGNRHDSTTLKAIVRLLEWRFGKAKRVWVMDRGIASEENLEWLRGRGGHYLVGTPKSQLRQFEKQMLEADWKSVREGLDVAFVRPEEGVQETYVLCRSRDRREKEKAMLERFASRMQEGLKSLQAACRRKTRPVRDRLELGKRLGVLMKLNSRARSLFEVEVVEDDGRLDLRWTRKEQGSWAELSAGHYLLRTNLSGEMTPEELWRAYIQLTEVEAAFRSLKTDLGVRPIYHQRDERVKAHVFVCFLALCLRKALQMRLECWGLGRSVEKVLGELARWRQMDVVLETTDGRELRRRVIANPDPELKILLQRMLLPMPRRSVAEPAKEPIVVKT